MDIDIKNVLKKNRIIPIAVLDNIDDTLKISELLLENSLYILEITLRTDTAYDCIGAAARKYPELTLGAGSVLSKESLQRAYDSGISFAVSPSLDIDLVDYSENLKLPFVPGISTPTELNAAIRKSDIIKIFPISQLGGVEYLKSIIAPFIMKEFSIIPTGGISQVNFTEYLKLDAVIACGMSYMVNKKLIEGGDFTTLDKRIKEVLSSMKDS